MKQCIQCSDCEYFGSRFTDETLPGAFDPGACNVVVPSWLNAMACLNPNGVDRRVYPDNGCDLGKLKLKEKNNG
jgi:hypothetical protein